MCPVEGLTDSLRMPRLGKIRLGIKVEGEKSYPKAVDYFVCPPEVRKVFGEKPKDLRILLPTESSEEFASTWYRAYSFRGLVCKGDGKEAVRLVDLDETVDKKTGEMPQGDTPQEWKTATSRSKKVDYHQITCPGRECPDFQAKLCRPIMNLQFLLPDVPGLGVWQLDTSSLHSIGNVLGAVKLIRGLLGKVSMIPLTLSVEPREVQPKDVAKKTVWVLNLRAPQKLSELVQFASLPAGQILLPEPDRDAPDDLMPEEVLEQADAPKQAPSEAPESSPASDAPKAVTVHKGSTFTADEIKLALNGKHLPEWVKANPGKTPKDGMDIVRAYWAKQEVKE